MNKFSSIFGQILQIFSKNEFYRAVRETQAEKGSKRFTCWQQFVAMLFCQLGHAQSLREISGGFVLVTNHLSLGSTTIAAIYKDRWQIEIFFKTIKQNLKIKTFVGTSPNALMIQIWTALIAILILKYLKFRSTFGWSLSNLLSMLRYNLFTYRDLWEWIDNPYEVPPIVPDAE